jgi:hypothetical protein
VPTTATKLQLPLELGVDGAQELARAAFDENDPAALERAHKSLYAIYADRVWRPASSAQGAELTQVRRILETAFRGQLDRQRAELSVDITQPASDVARWLESIALGPHPLDDGSWGLYLHEDATLDAMKRVVAQRSLFFLREPDPWVYAIPTLTGSAKAGLIDLMLDEYGWGKLDRMHSTIYANLIEALDLPTEIDHFEGSASWQYLATLNHQWMCALDPSLSRRLLGTIYLTEADSPQAMNNYLAAYARLGIDDPRVLEFYELHVVADENHREIALLELVAPVAEAEGPEAAREIATGIFDARSLEAEFARSERALAGEAAHLELV